MNWIHCETLKAERDIVISGAYFEREAFVHDHKDVGVKELEQLIELEHQVFCFILSSLAICR